MRILSLFSAASLVMALSIPSGVRAESALLRVAGKGAQDAALRGLLEQVEERLPKTLVQELRASHEAGIRVVLNPKLPAPERADQLCNSGASKKKIVLGRVNAWFQDRLELNPWLIRELELNPEREIACTHGTIRRLALATVIHELAHLYDLRDEEGRHRFSDQTAFQKRTWTGGVPLRTPDAYELKNSAENFAVNLEFFLLDPEYACRRPTLNRYFQSIFGKTQLQTTACERDSTVFLHSQNIGKNLLRKTDLNPDRIYQVHFLFASRGPALMSRWGHAMYRLVVCAPERTEVGPDCLRDIQHHVVVSHRAAVDDLSISYWKGIFGKYPSQLFLYSLPEIVDEYTKLELRDMLSLPLKISDAEKQNFVNRVLEQYWGYSGRYLFFTNNCADEALQLVQAAEEGDAFAELRTLHPLGLYKKYIKAGLIDPALVEDKNEAERQGLFFRSKQAAYDKALRILDGAGASFGQTRVSEFAAATTADARRKVYQERARVVLSGAFYVLETFALMENQRKLSKAVTAELESLRDRKDPRAEKFLTVIASGMNRSRAPRFQHGYGVPLKSDFAPEDAAKGTDEDEKWTQLAKDVNFWLRETFGPQLDEISATSGNIAFFRKELLKTKTGLSD
ncbi:MAG: hypothetical protein A2X94_15440 [Bdellovibrionales bacterium GWB1_55_8]|nr:MAG: hypothetical protein A2X94_15440 [Bdellovibrionales bacterium GWB1_55_8]